MARTPKVNIKDAEWKPGRLMVCGCRHSIPVETPDGLVNFVYEVSGRTYRFMGVERTTPAVIDGEPRASHDHLPWTAVPRATWVRIYKQDAQRRTSFDRLS